MTRTTNTTTKIKRNKNQTQHNKIPVDWLKMSHKIATREFLAFGISIIHRRKNAYSTYARIYEGRGNPIKKIELAQFQTHFGVTPYVCRWIWILLIRNNLKPKGGTAKHLLWTLMFLKLYSTEKVLATIADCSPKTYMKWTWKFVRAISVLKSILVSVPPF